MLESTLQKQCITHCKQVGAFAVKVDSTSSRGWPDLTVVLPNGVVLFVELKTKTGVVSAMQQRMINKLERNRANVYVIRSIDEFKKLIITHTADR